MLNVILPNFLGLIVIIMIVVTLNAVMLIVMALLEACLIQTALEKLYLRCRQGQVL
jgi:hypothetical protein